MYENGSLEAKLRKREKDRFLGGVLVLLSLLFLTVSVSLFLLNWLWLCIAAMVIGVACSWTGSGLLKKVWNEEWWDVH